MKSGAYWKAKPGEAEYDEMRARLVSAAWEEISDYGVERLALNAVARRADCARSSVYRYFDNKEQLLYAVIQERLLEFGLELDKTLRRYKDPGEQMVRGVYLTVKAIRNGPALQLHEVLRAAEDGESAGLIDLDRLPALSSTLLYIDPVFSRAREQGLVRDGVSDDDVFDWLVMVVSSLVNKANYGSKPRSELAYLRKMLIPSIFKSS